jgi:hypothetical protein
MAVAGLLLGLVSLAALGVVGHLVFGLGVALGDWLTPLALGILGAAFAAILLFLVAWAFAYSAAGGLSAAVGRPLAWAAVVFALLIPALMMISVGGFFCLNLFAP